MTDIKQLERPSGRVSKRRASAACAAVMGTVFGLCNSPVWAGAREQAKVIHDRLVGTPASDATLTQMETDIMAGRLVDAAMYAINPANADAAPFYNVVLKNFATPWTSRDQSVFAPLNDYTATVIGVVRDDEDFRHILYDDVIYVPQAGYSTTSNAPYEALESSNADLSNSNVLRRSAQSAVNGLPSTATAGVITSRAASEAFFIDGTNRAMFRFTLVNHLCRDMEQVHDTSRAPDRIRQDVTRSPGGDSRIFLNNCVGCHSGMDPMAQAFAYYDFDETVSRLVYTPGQVQPKYLINSDNFKFGFVTPNDSWENRWRQGPNGGSLSQGLGWDAALPGSGQGAKSLGQELANSRAFAECQVEKVFRHVCFRGPTSTERANVTNVFTSGGYKLKQVFAEAAVACRGP
ncbi:MAG TPA: hypothetical protein VJS42_18240 [Steroidobacteraceae bacterium]|nr:hypothetical protein [Steroidobacteraceae bacterium]